MKIDFEALKPSRFSVQNIITVVQSVLILVLFVWVVVKPSPIPQIKIDHDQIVKDIAREIAPIRASLTIIEQKNESLLFKIDSLKIKTPSIKRELVKITSQIKTLNDAYSKIDYVNVSDSTLIKRLSGR